jgi:predicted DNA-binding transcriptional regulator AlpA
MGQDTSLLTIHDVAKVLRCSRRSVRVYVSQGLLPPPVKIGRLARWRPADLEAALARLAGRTSSRKGAGR